MTRRTYLEWHLVGEGEDPVPASGYDVRQVAKQFADRGSVMESAATTLDKFAGTDEWTGEAAKEFADKAGEAHSDLGKAADKYVDAGKALNTYADAVDDARSETAAAVADAVDADNRRRANSTSLLDGVDDPSDELKTADERRTTRLDTANDDLDDARTRLVNAMNALATAADTCRRAINAASGHFKDSRMDDIKGAVSAVIKVLVDALNIIAIVLAVIIIVLLVIGTGGAFLAVLLTAAFWVGVAIFALTAVQLAMGDAGWDDLGWAALGLLGGGIGKAMSGIAKGAMGAVRMSVVVRAADGAIDNLPILTRLAQRIPFAPIANWGARREGVAVYNAVMDAMAAMKPGQLATGLSRTLQTLGLDEAVQSLRTISAMRNMPLTPVDIANLNKATLATIGGIGGAGMQLTAQGRDAYQFPETVMNFPDSISDGIDGIADALDGVPDRPMPTTVTPAGR